MAQSTKAQAKEILNRLPLRETIELGIQFQAFSDYEIVDMVIEYDSELPIAFGKELKKELWNQVSSSSDMLEAFIFDATEGS